MNWLQRLLRIDRMEKELDAELRFHFETQVADKIQGGLTEAEARREVRLEFGGLEQVKEDCRESRERSLIETRHRVRSLSERPI